MGNLHTTVVDYRTLPATQQEAVVRAAQKKMQSVPMRSSLWIQCQARHLDRREGDPLYHLRLEMNGKPRTIEFVGSEALQSFLRQFRRPYVMVRDVSDVRRRETMFTYQVCFLHHPPPSAADG